MISQEFNFQECFPILNSCVDKEKIKKNVVSYLKAFVDAQEDFESLQRIQHCKIVKVLFCQLHIFQLIKFYEMIVSLLFFPFSVKDYIGNNDEHVYCTQNMLNQKYGQWFQCNIKTFKDLEQKLLLLQKSNSGGDQILSLLIRYKFALILFPSSNILQISI